MLPPEVIAGLPSPCYVIDLAALRRNLELLAGLRKELNLKILLALKSFAAWKLGPFITPFLDGTNAASINEAWLGLTEFGGEAHLTVPAYSRADIDELFRRVASRSNRPFTIVFNSLNQWRLYGRECRDRGLRCGLRVNPERPVGRMPIYDPSRPGSRLGIIRAELDAAGPAALDGISGLHFHVLCEQNSDALEIALAAFEEKFGDLIDRMEWVNFGGGHHFTRLARLHPDLHVTEDYDLDRLRGLVRGFQSRHPKPQIYFEPGEAISFGAGYLVTTVLDIVPRDLPNLILDSSAEAHMPDVIEAPYTPPVAGAKPWRPDDGPAPYTYRLTGNTCLAGDIVGEFTFDQPLSIGSKVVFMDQAYYTMVKNNTFNGINLPSIALLHEDGRAEVIKSFGFDDYRQRLS